MMTRNELNALNDFRADLLADQAEIDAILAGPDAEDRLYDFEARTDEGSEWAAEEWDRIHCARTGILFSHMVS